MYLVFYGLLQIPRDNLYNYLEIKFTKNASKDLYQKLDAIIETEIGLKTIDFLHFYEPKGLRNQSGTIFFLYHQITLFLRHCYFNRYNSKNKYPVLQKYPTKNLNRNFLIA